MPCANFLNQRLVFVLMCLAQLTTGASSRTPKRPYLILVDGDGLAVVGSMKIGDPNGFWTAGAEGVSSAVSEIKLVFSIPPYQPAQNSRRVGTSRGWTFSGAQLQ